MFSPSQVYHAFSFGVSAFDVCLEISPQLGGQIESSPMFSFCSFMAWIFHVWCIRPVALGQEEIVGTVSQCGWSFQRAVLTLTLHNGHYFLFSVITLHILESCVHNPLMDCDRELKKYCFNPSKAYSEVHAEKSNYGFFFVCLFSFLNS